MTDQTEPTPDPAGEAESRLPVPTGRPRHPGVPIPDPPARLRTALQRIGPAWPTLLRGTAVAATVGAAGLIAAKAGPRLLQRAPGLPPVPVGPSLAASPEAARRLASPAQPAPPELVLVTREFVRWTRIEVYRHPAGSAGSRPPVRP